MCALKMTEKREQQPITLLSSAPSWIGGSIVSNSIIIIRIHSIKHWKEHSWVSNEKQQE